jgi:hypothetical protein
MGTHLFIGVCLSNRAQLGFDLDSISNLDFPTELVMIQSKGEIFSTKNQAHVQSPKSSSTMSRERGPQNGAVGLHGAESSGVPAVSRTAGTGDAAAGCGLRWPG